MSNPLTEGHARETALSFPGSEIMAETRVQLLTYEGDGGVSPESMVYTGWGAAHAKCYYTALSHVSESWDLSSACHV